MIYMIAKKHDTINLITYNIIFIRCNATPRNNHRCPRDPSTTLTKWCEKHRCVHPAKGNFQWSTIACYTFASPDAFLLLAPNRLTCPFSWHMSIIAMLKNPSILGTIAHLRWPSRVQCLMCAPSLSRGYELAAEWRGCFLFAIDFHL